MKRLGPPPALALLSLVGALAANRAANALAERSAQGALPSPDVLFALLPRWDLRFLYLWGCAGFLVLMAWHALRRERSRVWYAAWLFALLIATKSLVVGLTPMRLPEDSLSVGGFWFYDALARHFTAHNDLFFSLHTALPFLGFLVFRDSFFRRLCLGASFLMGGTVLLCRLHYSMDVAAAYPITYALFRWERRWAEPFFRRG